MRVTIIKDDNTVTVNGEALTVDCSNLPATVHAIQWDGVHGEIEHRMTRCDHCGARSKKGNEILSSFATFQPYVDAWTIAKAQAEEAAKLFNPQGAQLNVTG